MAYMLLFVISCIIFFPAHFFVYENPYVIPIAATLLWLINIFIRPLAKALTIAAIVLTLGIFSIIINAVMVVITDFLIRGIDITSFLVEIFIALVISAGNILLVPKKSKK